MTFPIWILSSFVQAVSASNDFSRKNWFKFIAKSNKISWGKSLIDLNISWGQEPHHFTIFEVYVSVSVFHSSSSSVNEMPHIVETDNSVWPLDASNGIKQVWVLSEASNHLLTFFSFNSSRNFFDLTSFPNGQPKNKARFPYRDNQEFQKALVVSGCQEARMKLIVSRTQIRQKFLWG